jgi:hypothetical protein
MVVSDSDHSRSPGQKARQQARKAMSIERAATSMLAQTRRSPNDGLSLLPWRGRLLQMADPSKGFGCDAMLIPEEQNETNQR